MENTFLISDFEIKNPITQEVTGVAKSVDIVIQYTVGDSMAKGYFAFKDDTNTIIKYGRGNMDVQRGDDDTATTNNAIAYLGVTVI